MLQSKLNASQRTIHICDEQLERAWSEVRDLADQKHIADQLLIARPVLQAMQAALSASQNQIDCLHDDKAAISKQLRVLQYKQQQTQSCQRATNQRLDKVLNVDVKRLRADLHAAKLTASAAVQDLDHTIITAADNRSAWMPSINDANKGALGSFRVCLRDKPSLLMHQYNAQAVLNRNSTQQFMDAMLTEEEDEKYARAKVLEIDKSGESKWQKMSAIAYKQQVAEENHKKAADWTQKKQARTDHLSGIQIILNKAKLCELNKKELKDQVDLHRSLKFKLDCLKAKSELRKKKPMQLAPGDTIYHFLSLPESLCSISTLNVVENNVHITIEDGWESERSECS